MIPTQPTRDLRRSATRCVISAMRMLPRQAVSGMRVLRIRTPRAMRIPHAAHDPALRGQALRSRMRHETGALGRNENRSARKGRCGSRCMRFRTAGFSGIPLLQHVFSAACKRGNGNRAPRHARLSRPPIRRSEAALPLRARRRASHAFPGYGHEQRAAVGGILRRDFEGTELLRLGDNLLLVGTDKGPEHGHAHRCIGCPDVLEGLRCHLPQAFARHEGAGLLRAPQAPAAPLNMSLRYMITRSPGGTDPAISR